jgi:hypothetical protein
MLSTLSHRNNSSNNAGANRKRSAMGIQASSPENLPDRTSNLEQRRKGIYLEVVRKGAVMDCLSLAEILPSCATSIEAAKDLEEMDFTPQEITFLQLTFRDVTRNNLKVNDWLFVPGSIPDAEATVVELMLGSIDAVGVRVVEIQADGTIIVSCEGATGTAIENCWRQNEKVVLPNYINRFLAVRLPETVFTMPIGKGDAHVCDTPEKDPRGRARERGSETESEGEKPKKKRKAKKSSSRDYSSSSSEDEKDGRKTLDGFLVKCADGVDREVTTKAGAKERAFAVQGLLRIWSKETSDIFLRDLTLDFARIRRAASSRHPGSSMPDEYLEEELKMFEGLDAINYLPCIKDDSKLKRIIMGAWDLTGADRLLLSDFLVSKPAAGGWDITSEPLSKLIFFEACKNLQLCMGAVWGDKFAKAIRSIFTLQYEKKRLIHYYPSAYMAAMVEQALHRFHVIVFSEVNVSGSARANLRRTPRGCAKILRELMDDAMDTTQWEPFRCDMFFAPGGYYDLHCKVKAPKTAHGPTTAKTSAPATGDASKKGARKLRKRKAAATGTTTTTDGKHATTATTSTVSETQRTILCMRRLAEEFGPKGTQPCPLKDNCGYIHSSKAIYDTPRADVIKLLRGKKHLKNVQDIIKGVEASTGFHA